jgi:hypothetical protein
MRMRRILLVYIGIESIWNVMQKVRELKKTFCVHSNYNNSLLAAANHQLSRFTTSWQCDRLSYSCVPYQFRTSPNALISRIALQNTNKHSTLYEHTKCHMRHL